jgi:hypothetical protein
MAFRLAVVVALCACTYAWDFSGLDTPRADPAQSCKLNVDETKLNRDVYQGALIMSGLNGILGKSCKVDANLLKKADDSELSVRSHNCLKNDGIVYIGDLVVKSEAQMLKTPNFGKKSLNEIKELLDDMNLKFGMEVENWPPKNIEELAECYLDEK